MSIPSKTPDDLKLHCLTVLKNKDWINSSLLPEFRKSLAAHLNLSEAQAVNMSTTMMTVQRYSPQNRVPVLHKKPDFHIVTSDDVNSDFWRNATSVIGRKCCLDHLKPGDNNLFRALELIAEFAPQTDAVLRHSVDHFCILDSDELRSASHPHYFGTIFLVPQENINDFAMSLVHELAHQELFLLNLIDRLVYEGRDYALAHAPYQGKHRPPIGRLHSAHALHRMIVFGRKIGHDKVGRYSELLRETVKTFDNNELTPFARQLIDEVY